MSLPKHDYLKTKCTSLGAEVKLIRQYERARFRKASKLLKNHIGYYGKGWDIHLDRSIAYHMDTANGLREHRLNVVQPEARWANLAYGMLRGQHYQWIERDAHIEPEWDRIEKLVLTFGERDNPRYNETLEERFKDWVDVAREYWKGMNKWRNAFVKEGKPLDVDAIGNNQIGYMEPNSEYMLNTKKAPKRAAYVPNTVCVDSEKGI